MTQYFLGVDIGGTKSHALVADGDGRALGFGEAGPGNWESVGWAQTRAVLHNITAQALAAAGLARTQIAGAGFGIAGYDWPEDRPPHVEIIRSLALDAPFELVNDAVVGLIAGAEAGWGVGVAAGTSCNCYGRSATGAIGRLTGSSWFGEYAGAGELVHKAIQAVARAWTRRGPATRLTDAFLRITGATDAADLFGGLMRQRYRLGAADAPLVFATAEAGDEVAQGLVRWAGQELGGLAVGVIRQLELEALSFEVVLSGSFYNGSPVIEQEMAATIHAVAPGARLVRLAAPPVIGGVLLGMEQVGADTSLARRHLIHSTNELTQVASYER